MKKATLAAFIAIVMLSCGSGDSTGSENKDTTTAPTPAASTAEAPVPADIEAKFVKIMDEYQHKISHDFWSEFQSTTRRGEDGTTETTFDATAFENFMTKKGFVKVPATSMDYKGTVNDVDVSISEKTTSGEKGGWIHNWTIEVQASSDAGTFKKQREFSLQPGS